MSGTVTRWYVAVNTFTPGHGDGTVLSSHKTARAAWLACQHAQPRERNSYLPTTIVISKKRLGRGWCVSLSELEDGTEDFEREVSWREQCDIISHMRR